MCYDKRKICFVITSRIHYGRSKMILDEIKKHPALDLQIVVGASAILPTYGDILSIMEKDGFKYNAKIIMTLEGGSPVAMAKTAGIGITEFATAFDNLQPDIVVLRGDRYEVLSAAVAAAYLNIPVAHIEGGDITGTIDESVRHAITKLAHIHFPTNEDSKQRILSMGEDPDYVFNVGCPGLEFIDNNRKEVTNEYLNEKGVGDAVDIAKPYLLVMQHPVTTEFGDNRHNTVETLEAVLASGMQAIWFWPNVDAGTDEVSKAIRSFREEHNPKGMRFIKYIPAEEFTMLLDSAACLVGNSSAGIKEASFLGVSVVNIGTRQRGRRQGKNVVNVSYNREEILDAIKHQVAHGRYERDEYYYRSDTSKNMVNLLANIKLYTQKFFHDPKKYV